MSPIAAACQHPDHEGRRLVDRRDLTERRVEWRDLVTQGRHAVRMVRRDCKACVRRELVADVLVSESML